MVEPATVDHLDAYTAPRLVEYHDPDPCALQMVGALPAAPVRAMTKSRGSGDIAYRGIGAVFGEHDGGLEFPK